jgi:hypothetical protein
MGSRVELFAAIRRGARIEELSIRELARLWLAHSGKAVRRIYPTQAQEAFLQGHIEAFEAIGGVPTRHIKYDNLTSAVAKVVQGPGRARNENARWVLFRSHYLLTELPWPFPQVSVGVSPTALLLPMVLDPWHGQRAGAVEGSGGVEGAVRMGILPRGRPLTLARRLAAGRSPQPICSASSTMIPSGPRT